MRLKWNQILTTLLLSLFITAAPVHTLSAGTGQVAAMLTEVQGKVLLDGTQAVVFAELPSGAKLKLSEGSNVTLVLIEQGDEFTLTGPALVTIQTDGVFSDGKRLEGIDLIESAGIDLDLGDMAQAAIVMRGKLDKNQRPILEYPVDTNILTPHPTFSWLPAGVGFQYQFALTDQSNQSLYTLITSREFTELPSSISLPSDETLTWKIDASHPSTPDEVFSATSTFMLLPGIIARQVDSKRPRDNASRAEKARYAKFLKSLNLKAEAERYLKELARK